METLRTAILKSLYFNRMQSIAELSENLGKSIPLVTKTVKELVEEKLILENGHRASTGGRRAMNFVLNKEKHGILIAVAIDQYFCNITAYDIVNNQLDSIYTKSIDLFEGKNTYEDIEQLIQSSIQKNQHQSITAIGITMPGFVDFQEKINNSFPTHSTLYALREHIHKKFGYPTYIENDSTAIAIAEKHFGLAKNCNNALVINFSWGVGLGMIIENHLFRGSSGFAGEFSHIPLANANKLCSCGKKGCLEVEASLRCAIDYIIEALEKGEQSCLGSTYLHDRKISFEHLLQAYQHGDQLAIKAIKKIAYMLGKGVATLIHILNPERIIISGRGAAFGQNLLHEIQSSNQEFCIPRLSQKTVLQISNLQHTQLLSSACIAIQQMEWKKNIIHIKP